MGQLPQSLLTMHVFLTREDKLALSSEFIMRLERAQGQLRPRLERGHHCEGEDKQKEVSVRNRGERKWG